MCDKKPWSQFEDEALTAVITNLKDNLKWCKVEKTLRQNYGIKNRSGKQCKERWRNNLDPNCRKREWTEEEDLIIFNYQQKHGNNWSKISKFLVGRSENTIKNHFYATIRRKLRRHNKLNKDKIDLCLKDIIGNKDLVRLLMEVPEKAKSEESNEIRRSNRILDKQNDSKKTGDSDSEKNENSYICAPLAVKENSLLNLHQGIDMFSSSDSKIMNMESMELFGNIGSFSYSNPLSFMSEISQHISSFSLCNSFQYPTNRKGSN